jgi:hypothetical protein
MAGPAGVPGFYDPKRAQRPGLGKASLDAGQVVPLTVSLPPGSSLATTNSELNGNYSEAQSKLAAAQASGDPAAIDKAQTNVYLRETQLNTFVKGQNDTTRSTLDEKNYNAPGANTIATTTATAAEGNRDDRPAISETATQTAEPTSFQLIPFDNILHGYSNYTYRFSLYILTESDYNTLVNDPSKTVDLQHLLIASGGAAQDKRAPHFKEDFYFESVDMQIVIGSGNTNSCDFTIKIIEPYGVTLIEKMVKAASELVESNNYVDQPYLLALDFWGYDDEAIAPKKIDGCTRYFTINIVNVEFSVTSKGAEYEFRACPYSGIAMKQAAAEISSAFEVSAKTVAEFFGDSTEALAAVKSAAGATAAPPPPPPRDDSLLTKFAVKPTQAVLQATSGTAAPKPSELNGSLSYVLNQQEQKKKADNAIEIPDEYIFKIDKEIADATILAPDDKSIKDVPMKTELFKKYSAAASSKNITYESDKRKIAVTAGTTLVNLINDIVLHSTYTLDQIIATDDKEAETLKSSKPIEWLRIVPDVELLGYDKKLNRYAKRYIFNLYKTSIFGHFHDQMGQAPPPGAAKIYDYFYTGQNKDIIDLKIDYKADGLTYLNANRGIKAGSTPAANIDNNPDKTDTSNPSGDAFPTTVAVSNSPALNSAARASTNSNDLIINDVKNSLLTGYGEGADMVKVDMNIVGDPAYITQSDIFYGQQTKQFADMPVLPDKSLNPCVTEIYALLRFNTPNDLDLENGIYDFTDKGKDEVSSSSFTGLYKVITVRCSFTGGKFTQNLEMLRQRNQSSNYVIQSAAKAKFTKQDVSPENIKKLTENSNKIFSGLATDLLDLASSLAPVKNLLNGRNLV